MYNHTRDHYLNQTERDFPIRENPDFIDFVIMYSTHHKTKQMRYLAVAKQMVMML